MSDARHKTSRRTPRGLVIGVALLVLVGLGIIRMNEGDSPDATTKGGVGCDFSKEPAHAASEDPCSPHIDWDDFEWRGVEINMPARFELPGHEYPGLNPYESRVPVYILLQTTALRALRYPLEMEGIALFFVDRASGARFTSHLGVSGTQPEDLRENTERSELSEEDLEGRVVRFYYNLNALEFLQLPNAAATYDVHATFEDYSSRVMAITLE